MTADSTFPTVLEAGGFHTTRWTQVSQAKEPSDDGRIALRDLCAAYYAPVIAFLQRRGHAMDAARELAHAFFARMLEGDAIGGADHAQGRFRSYLLGAVKHFLAHRHESEHRQRCGAGVLPLSIEAEAGDSPALKIPDLQSLSPEAAFDRQWAVTVLARAMEALRLESEAGARRELFERVQPWLIGEGAYGDQGVLAESLGLSVNALKVAVHRLKRRYRQLIKAEIGATLRDESLVEEEMHALFSALGG